MQQPAEKLPPHSYYKLMCFPLYNRVSLLQALSSIRLLSTFNKNATYVRMYSQAGIIGTPIITNSHHRLSTTTHPPNSPDAVEDEEELNEDTAKRKNPSHHD